MFQIHHTHGTSTQPKIIVALGNERTDAVVLGGGLDKARGQVVGKGNGGGHLQVYSMRPVSVTTMGDDRYCKFLT